MRIFPVNAIKHPWLISLMLMTVGLAMAQSPSWQWVKTFGGPNYEIGNSVVTDPSGNILVAGSFRSPSFAVGSTTLTNSGTNYNPCLVKYDASGSVLWAKSGFGDGFGNAVATDATGNVYLTGSFSGDSIKLSGITLHNTSTSTEVFVAKYDASGNILWAKCSTGISQSGGVALSCDNAGNVFVVGGFYGLNVTFGNITLTNAATNGTQDIFLVKYNSNGNAVWAKRYGGTDHEYGATVVTDAGGALYFAGAFGSSSVNFDSHTVNNASLTGSTDIFIAECDTGGNVSWAKGFGGSSTDAGTSLVLDNNGRIYLTGTFQSATVSFGSSTVTNSVSTYADIFLARLDINGNPLWAKSAGGSQDDKANSVACDANGAAYITGAYQSGSMTVGSYTLTNAGTGLQDIFVARYDSVGTAQWATSVGNTDNEAATCIAASAGGNFYITGRFFSSPLSFGACTAVNVQPGVPDAFVAKLVAPVSIHEFRDGMELTVFPNPSQGIFSFSLPLDAISVHVFNSMGEEIKNMKVHGSAEKIDLSQCENGIYFLNVSTFSGIINQKLIISK